MKDSLTCQAHTRLATPQFYSFSLAMAKDARSIPNALTVVVTLLPLAVGPGCS